MKKRGTQKKKGGSRFFLSPCIRKELPVAGPVDKRVFEKKCFCNRNITFGSIQIAERIILEAIQNIL